jgi:beta-phosphoglucomutase
MHNRYDAILFDFDGVLVDSEPLHWKCWCTALAPRGIKLDWAHFAAHCVGVTDRELFRHFPPGTKALPEEEFLAALAEKRRVFRARAVSAGLVSEAVSGLLRQLAQTLPLAVVTSSSRLDVEPVLRAAKVDGCFAASVYREDVTHAKPDAEPYRTAARQLGARRPLVVEDSDAGQASAAAAGFKCLRVTGPAAMPRAVLDRLA